MESKRRTIAGGFKKGIHWLLLLFACLVAMAVLEMSSLYLVYQLPTDTITRHISSGVFIYESESVEFEYAEGYKASIHDNQTDAIMLSEVIYPTDHSMQDVLLVPHYSLKDHASQLESLLGLVRDGAGDTAVLSVYPRYWHGYLVFLKIFFCFFDFADLRIMNQMVQLILIFTVLILMQKRGLSKYLPGFIALILFWNPATTGVCLQYTDCFVISLIAAILVLRKCDFLTAKRERIMVFFCLIGCLTSFLDFLTYPIVTLGVPLLFFLLMSEMWNVRESIISVISWGIGYAGNWAAKWILASLLTDADVIADAASKLLEKSSINLGGGESVSRLTVIREILCNSFLKWSYVIGITLLLVAIAIWQSRSICKVDSRMNTQTIHSCDPAQSVADGKSVRGGKRSNHTLIQIAMTALLPLAWYIMAPNHTYWHQRLTYRALGVTLFAGIIIWTDLTERVIVRHHRKVISMKEGFPNEHG